MEKELEKVKGALEDFGKKVVDAVKKGKVEADKVTKVAQVKIELGSLNRQRRDLFQELGELFYGNYRKASKKGQDDIAETVTHIVELDRKISRLNREMKAIRSDKPLPRRRGRPAKAEAAAPEAAPGKKGRPRKAASGGAPKKRKPSVRKGAAGAAEKPATGAAKAPRRRGRPPKAAQ
ncbi:MAG: hypothetical protein JSV00_00250 [bacterium]|nr:MAG: hypothetical protein JSV00_00250 [bacterium]